jgi:glycogen synthase
MTIALNINLHLLPLPLCFFLSHSPRKTQMKRVTKNRSLASLKQRFQDGRSSSLRIAISSHLFHPSIGGIQTVSRLLAEEFVAAGHIVKVVTQTSEVSEELFPYEVIRCPDPLSLLNLVRWCDVLLHSNISLRTTWPLLFAPRPWIVVHHTLLTPSGEHPGIAARFKQALLHWANGISVSEAMAEQIESPSQVIPNPYSDDQFYEMPQIPRSRDLVFLGRLVSQKGVDLLLKALWILKKEGLTPCLTVIGSGEMREELKQLTDALGLAEQVSFESEKTGLELSQLLNAHRIMVIPSRPFESFGVVALEGIACGCVVVGADQGGLKEAIGPCGVTFQSESADALAMCLRDLLLYPIRIDSLRSGAAAHLAQHKRRAITAAYLKQITRLINVPV